MQFLKKKALELIQDESGQGTTEYILMLVAAVAVALVFGKGMKGRMEGIVSNLQDKIGTFMGEF